MTTPLKAVDLGGGNAELREWAAGDTLPVSQGGTGAGDVAGARANLSVRELLTAARTYYVRTDGSDANNGLTSTVGGAFATIQKAVDTAAMLDLGIYDVTINVAAGTFAPATFKTLVGAGIVNIVGSGDTTIVRASVASTYCFGNPIADGHQGVYSLSNMLLQATASGCIGINCSAGFAAQVVFGGINFGGFVGGFHIFAGRGALITNAGQPYGISGAASWHAYVTDGGQIRTSLATITITGTPSFAVFATAERGGTVLCNGVTYSGSATGKRYSATLCGGVLAAAGGNYLPGNVAGTTATGGWYA